MQLSSLSVAASSVAASSVASMQSAAPPQFKPFKPIPNNTLRWDLTPIEILSIADLIMAKSRALYNTVGALKPDEINYDNVIKALCEDATVFYTARLPLHFIQHVSYSREVRDASYEAEKKLSSFDEEISMKEDVFKVLLEAQKKFGNTLKPEAKRFLERNITYGKRNGLHLSKDIQMKIADLMKTMNGLSIDFVQNLADNNTTLKFQPSELEGLPPDDMNTIARTADGRCKIPLSSAVYLQCMKYVKSPDIRMKLETAFNSRCMKENAIILEKLVSLRDQKAKLLSYPNHAAYILDMRMAKTPERVDAFLNELQKKLQPMIEDDMRLFLEYKKADCEASKTPFDGKINLWDTRFYMTRVEERKYAVDGKSVRKYFPLHVVTHGLLEIYQELLNLQFELMENGAVWHPTVTVYGIKDRASDSLIGYFYLDLVPRSGKYEQAACFALQPACYLSNGSRQIGIAALVANFTAPVIDTPVLLTHDEVETFFHEFGHVMHQVCAETEFAVFSGANVEKDFVEAPSQMLENWCWERDSLTRMSAHYKDGSAIPNELLTALINSRRANGGILIMWQILLAKFDQAIHTKAESKTEEMFAEMSQKIIGIAPIKGTNTPATFTHMACGFDAQYYSYLWSEVYSADMFFRCKKDGLRNPKMGMDYRSMILKPGGTMDADEMVRAFLGRDLDPTAFFKVKGFIQ